MTCPTPGKVVYDSRAHARTHLKSGGAPLKDGQMRPYLCPCGGWHLTSMTRRQVKAVLRRAA